MKRGRFPQRVKRGSCVVTIYRTPTRGYDAFTVSHYDTRGKFCRRTFANYAEARSAAEITADDLANGKSDSHVLTAQELFFYQRATEALKLTSVPLDVAAIQFTRSMGNWNGSTANGMGLPQESSTMLPAVKAVPVAEVVNELLASKRAKGRSHLYLTDLRIRLTPFAKALDRPLREIQSEDIAAAADPSPGTRGAGIEPAGPSATGVAGIDRDTASATCPDPLSNFPGPANCPHCQRKPVPSTIARTEGRAAVKAEQWEAVELTFNAERVKIIFDTDFGGDADDLGALVMLHNLKNIEDLLKSKPDAHSDLPGKALIEQKVKEFVIMGGHFPQGRNEWNFNGNMPGVTRYVLQELTVPVVFSGFELGVQIKTGAAFNRLDPGHPLHIGYRHFSEHAPWMKQYYRGKILDNASYDQTAVLYAVRGGVGKYWDKVNGGRCVAEENGDNRWVEGEGSNHSYLVLKEPAAEMADLITAVMLNAC